MTDTTTTAAAAHETSDLPTRRQWAADRKLAVSLEQQRQAGKRPGGRLSAAAKEAIQKAEANGQRFSD